MQKIYSVLGMTCSGCQSKISETLNNIPNIQAEILLEESWAKISSEKPIDLDELNNALKSVGNYVLEDLDAPKNTAFIPPQDRVSPSSVYYCPMECEGNKVYFVQGKRCPDCNMYLVPIEEKNQTKTAIQPEVKHSSSNAGKYYCPMYCEGEKVYDSNVGCPICGMDLVQIPDKNGAGAEDKTVEILTKKLIISLGFTIPVFILSMGGMWLDFGISQKWRGIIEFLLTLPVLFYSGWFLMDRGIKSFKTNNLNMFSLIALGVFFAFLFSCVVLLFPEILPHEMMHGKALPLYFEAVTVIITLVILGQLLEAKAHKKTGKAIQELMQLSPNEAHLIQNGKEKTIPVSEVKVGDLLRVKTNEKIPIDGIIVEGATSVDESMITGEAIPVEKKLNDKIIAGTLNGNRSFIMKAEKISDETLLSKIIEMVAQASRTKAPMQKLADKVAKIFVPTVVTIAVFTFLAWYILGGENALTYALLNAVAVLIVACPCALGLATPMSMMVGIGKGAKNGILIKNAQALEQMHKANILITDKTGTLTEGKPVLEFIETEEFTSENQVLEFSVLLSERSEHPLANAVLEKYEKTEKKFPSFKISNFENISGKGVLAEFEKEQLLLGNEALLKDYGLEISSLLKEKSLQYQKNAKTISFLAKGGKVLGFLVFSDKIKKEAKQAIQFLQNKGIEIIMMTGDSPSSAQYVADYLGIKQYIAQTLPQDKMQKVKALQNEGNIVAMAGDGTNDAPALAQANIGIAMGTGSDVSIETADITLLKGDIFGVVKAHKLSEELLENIKQNLFFAFLYNTIGIPIAAGLLYPIFGILLSPMVAAIAMSFSSVSVILNSLRLNKLNLNQV